MTMHDEGCGIYVIGRTEQEVREAGERLRARLVGPGPSTKVSEPPLCGARMSLEALTGSDVARVATEAAGGPASILERLGRLLWNVPAGNVVPLRYWDK